MSAVLSSKCLKLKELTDDSITNSYNEFSHKGKLELQVMGYWKFVEGTQLVPPVTVAQTIAPIFAHFSKTNLV